MFLKASTNASMNRKSLGFTMLELISTVAITSVIASFAIPNINSIAEANQKSKATSQVVSLINEARQRAVNGATKVVVCPLDENASCSSDWALPVSAFNDDNENQMLDYNEDLLNTIDFTELANRIEWHSFSKKPYIQFDDTGATGDQSGQLFLCSATTTDKQVIIISAAGHTRIAKNEEKVNACI